MLSRILAVLLASAGLFYFAPSVAAQQAQQTNSQARHAVYIELLGLAGLYSLNYDHQFSGGWFARAGLEILGDGVAPNKIAFFPLFPLSVGTFVGEGVHRIEVGAGVVVGHFPSEMSPWPSGFALAEASMLLGYRYQPRPRGLVLRAGFAPLMISAEGGGIQSLQRPGVSVGYAF